MKCFQEHTGGQDHRSLQESAGGHWYVVFWTPLTPAYAASLMAINFGTRVEDHQRRGGGSSLGHRGDVEYATSDLDSFPEYGTMAGLRILRQRSPHVPGSIFYPTKVLCNKAWTLQ